MAAAISYPVRSPQWVLTYGGVDVTADLMSSVASIGYTDYLSELSGEIEIVVEDRSHLWQTSWYPSVGDDLNLAIGYQNEGLMPCGDFQIDQLELSGPSDSFTIRGLAAFITPAMRTANSSGYEGQSLLEIAELIAAKYGMSVISAPDVIDIAYERVTQRHETDLAFLKRLAIENGYDFTVRGVMLVFYSRAALEATPALLTITRNNVEGFEFRNRTHGTYGSAQVTYQNANKKALITQTTGASTPFPINDVLKLIARAENSQQAAAKAQAALDIHNMHFVEANLTMPGSITMAAGSTIRISGFGQFDGTYLIEVARHQINRAHGYLTRLEVCRVL